MYYFFVLLNLTKEGFYAIRSLWLPPLFSDFLVEYLTEQEQEAAAEGTIYLLRKHLYWEGGQKMQIFAYFQY